MDQINIDGVEYLRFHHIQDNIVFYCPKSGDFLIKREHSPCLTKQGNFIRNGKAKTVFYNQKMKNIE